ncbi:superoxide dismutase [Ni] [Estrella lausannensis]|uniref:Putative secreted protein n=1 Tax=Estrella lausannensis TaxID=483423 RepID=A0A0H5DP61_9BACT|nr:superoxide dismutase [Ni] [Estrella lausannensis]CRX38152.1 putative secreted protein [Estrella lausannensis]
MKKLIIATAAFLIATAGGLHGHCQMPCGIYHDDMVYDLIDQYVETMHKAISELKMIKFDTVQDKNQFIRWIMQKEKMSDDVSDLIMKYFLQQKIKPDEQDTAEKVVSAHKLLFLAVCMKQVPELKTLYEFMEEWKKFKHMFHREGYSCKIEEIKLKKWEQEAAEMKKQEAEEKAKAAASTKQEEKAKPVGNSFELKEPSKS